MSLSLQVLYPITKETNFNYEYYFEKHMKLVKDTFGDHLDSTLVTKGIASGPNKPAVYYAIATMIFKNQSAMDLALSRASVVMEDIPNYTNTDPVMLIGEVIL
tara:strand:+ start:436 stop:744 length:309 start_codon:yes stop_codon:yes gene_type:complete